MKALSKEKGPSCMDGSLEYWLHPKEFKHSNPYNSTDLFAY